MDSSIFPWNFDLVSRRRPRPLSKTHNSPAPPRSPGHRSFRALSWQKRETKRARGPWGAWSHMDDEAHLGVWLRPNVSRVTIWVLLADRAPENVTANTSPCVHNAVELRKNAVWNFECCQFLPKGKYFSERPWIFFIEVFGIVGLIEEKKSQVFRKILVISRETCHVFFFSQDVFSQRDNCVILELV